MKDVMKTKVVYINDKIAIIAYDYDNTIRFKNSSNRYNHNEYTYFCIACQLSDKQRCDRVYDALRRGGERYEKTICGNHESSSPVPG